MGGSMKTNSLSVRQRSSFAPLRQRISVYVLGVMLIALAAALLENSLTVLQKRTRAIHLQTSARGKWR